MSCHEWNAITMYNVHSLVYSMLMSLSSRYSLYTLFLLLIWRIRGCHLCLPSVVTVNTLSTRTHPELLNRDAANMKEARGSWNACITSAEQPDPEKQARLACLWSCLCHCCFWLRGAPHGEETQSARGRDMAATSSPAIEHQEWAWPNTGTGALHRNHHRLWLWQTSSGQRHCQLVETGHGSLDHLLTVTWKRNA